MDMKIMVAIGLVIGVVLGIFLAPLLDENYKDADVYCENMGYPSSKLDVIANPSGGIESVDITCSDATENMTLSLDRQRIIGI